MGFNKKTNDVLHTYQKAVHQRHRDPRLAKDLVREAYDDPPSPLKKSQPNTSKSSENKGTIFNQFFSPNPEAKPALPDPNNLNDQLQNLESRYKTKTKSMMNLIDRNVQAKQKEDLRRHLAEQKRRQDTLNNVQANNLQEKYNLDQYLTNSRKQEASTEDKKAIDEKNRYLTELGNNQLNRRLMEKNNQEEILR